MNKTSDRYVKVVAWSEEDQCYVGRCPGLMFGGVHGSDETRVYAELCEAVEEWIRLYRRVSLEAPTRRRRFVRKKRRALSHFAPQRGSLSSLRRCRDSIRDSRIAVLALSSRRSVL